MIDMLLDVGSHKKDLIYIYIKSYFITTYLTFFFTYKSKIIDKANLNCKI